MASQVSPGVVIRERDLTNTTIVGSQALRAAFAGAFQKGPVETPTAINSQKELVDTFGGPVDANAEDWFVASEFLNYGGRLVVSRAVDASAAVAANGSFSAANEGSWGNDLQVVAVDRGYDQSVTFTGVPSDVANGDTLTFTGGKTAKIYGWDAVTESAFLVGDKVAAGDLTPGNNGVIATFTDDAGVDANREPGTYSYTDPVKGAVFEVVVLDAGVEGGGAANGVGGTTTVTLTSGGADYAGGNTITIPDSSLGGGGGVAIEVTVATLVAQIPVATAVDWYRNTSLTIGTFSLRLIDIGPRPGTSQQGSDLGFSRDEFHIAVVSKSTGVVLETFQYLSKLQGGKSANGGNTYFSTLVNQQSQNISLGAAPFTIVASSGVDWTAGATDSVEEVSGELALLGAASVSLSGGDDAGYAYSTDAINVFTSYDATDLDFILMGGSGADETATLSKASNVIAIANARKDCVAFVSPHKGNQLDANNTPLAAATAKDNTIAFFDQLASTSYAVFDSGYKYLYDRFNDVYRYIPCNGDVAGLCVSTSASLADWYSPAGQNRGSLQNAIKLAYNPSRNDRDELYTSRINPIVSLRGSGITLFGDKTALSSPSAFDRINVRRLFLNIERRVDALAQGVLFEQNDVLTRTGFASAVNAYLAEIKADRGLTDFLVVCDESNNTPAVIDRNEFVADLYLQPTRSINFVTVTLTATRTGVSFSEVTGQ